MGRFPLKVFYILASKQDFGNVFLPEKWGILETFPTPPGYGAVWDLGMFVYFLVKQEAKMENVTDFEMSFR